jgi:hypothetical protein
VAAYVLDAADKETSTPIIYTAILSLQVQAAKGLVKLVVSAPLDRKLYGPFLHYLTNLQARPAIILGSVGDSEILFTEDWGLYSPSIRIISSHGSTLLT